MKQSDLFPEADIIRDQEISKLQKEVDLLNRAILRANIPEEDQVKRKDDPIDQDPIDRAAEQICDDYCKFSESIKNSDILHRICEECPLNILMTGGFKKC